MKNRGMTRRPLALTAATTLALGGLFFSTPAFAGTTDQSADQQDSDEVSAALAQAAEDANVYAWGTNAAGDPVVVVVDDAADGDIEAFAAEAFAADAEEPIVTTIPSAPVSFADGDVVGGQGYLLPTDDNRVSTCSFGFAAWSPAGDPAFLSAGHCAQGPQDLFLSDPSLDSGSGSESEYVGYGDGDVLAGTFGFSQFGGTGNSAGRDETRPMEDQNFTDIAVIDVDAASDYTPVPAVTTWSSITANAFSPADDVIEITAVGNPVAGSVSKSGRTTGYTTGMISEASGHILDGFSNIDGHFVRGFSSNVIAGPGDSGGAVFQGSTAVGVISGGTEATETTPQWTWSTLLTDALTYTSGYEVALHIEAPVVTSAATVEVGATVTGTATGAETVEVTLAGDTFEAAVTNGAFSFPAPAEPGDYSYSLTAVNGFNVSEATAYELTVEAAATPAPAITSPADGSSIVDEVTSVSGTGLPGAEVVVTIDGTGYPTTVGTDGTWTVDGLDLGYGEHAISVVQTANGETSSAVTSEFTVVLASPEITSITDGSTFAPDNGPSELSGTGIEGATVEVVLTGTEPAAFADSGPFEATVTDGVWTVAFDAPLSVGDYTATATQTLDGASSASTVVSFQVVAAPAPGDEGDNGDQGGNAGDPGDEGTLATTGMDTTLTLALSAGAVVLVAGGLMLMILRRRKLAALQD